MIAFAVPAFAVPVGHVLAASGNAEPAARFSWLTAKRRRIGGSPCLCLRWGLLGAVVAILAGMSTSLIFSVVARRVLGLNKPQGLVTLLHWHYCLVLQLRPGLLVLSAPSAP